MKHYLIIFREDGPRTIRSDRLDEIVRREFPGCLCEYDTGINVISTSRSADEVLKAISPDDGISLSDVLMVLELGATGAVGCAGSDFVRELGQKIRVLC